MYISTNEIGCDCTDESDEFDCPEEDVTTIEPEVGIDDPTSDYDYDPGYFDPNAGAVVTPNDTSVNYDYYLPDDYQEREYNCIIKILTSFCICKKKIVFRNKIQKSMY